MGMDVLDVGRYSSVFLPILLFVCGTPKWSSFAFADMISILVLVLLHSAVLCRLDLFLLSSYLTLAYLRKYGSLRR